MVIHQTASSIAVSTRGWSHTFTSGSRAVASLMAAIDQMSALASTAGSPRCSRFQAARQSPVQNRACLSMGSPDAPGGNWTLLSGHGHVLVEIARNPGARMRDISAVVDLTERTVQAIVADLLAAGYVTRTRNGRRNFYAVNRDSRFRHSAQDGQMVGPFLDLLTATGIVASPG